MQRILAFNDCAFQRSWPWIAGRKYNLERTSIQAYKDLATNAGFRDDPYLFVAPGGEGLGDIRRRCKQAIDQIVQEVKEEWVRVDQRDRAAAAAEQRRQQQQQQVQGQGGGGRGAVVAVTGGGRGAVAGARGGRAAAGGGGGGVAAAGGGTAQPDVRCLVVMSNSILPFFLEVMEQEFRCGLPQEIRRETEPCSSFKFALKRDANGRLSFACSGMYM